LAAPSTEEEHMDAATTELKGHTGKSGLKADRAESLLR